MIGYISGKVVHISEKLIIEVSGIGYEVFVPQKMRYACMVGNTISLYVVHIIREQEWRLFGFVSHDEKVLFELLLSVSGIGPKTALVFFEDDISSLSQAIARKDDAYISSFKGIGKKTAERLVLDLHSKIPIFESIHEYAMLYPTLESLGFSKDDIMRWLQQAPAGMDDEACLRWFLQQVQE